MKKTAQRARELYGDGAYTRGQVEELYRDQEVATTYDQDRFSSYKGRLKHVLEMDAIMACLKGESVRRLLDVATGTGRIAHGVSAISNCPLVVGMDQSLPMLMKAHAKSGAVHLAQASSFDLPLQDACVDAVTAVLFVRHFKRDARRALLADMRRVLVPGGLLILDVANRAYHEALVPDRPVYDEIYTQSEFRDEMQDNGFAVERFFGVPVHLPYVHRIVNVLRSDVRGQRLELMLNRLLRGCRFFVHRCPVWIAKCRKLS